MNRLRAFLFQGSILALAAAGSVDAQAQLASPPPGRALVVLYRSDKQPVGAKVPVIVNAERLGNLGNGEFLNATVNPGRTFLRVGDRILTTLALQTAPNRSYYVLVEAVPGLTPVRVEMREMTEASARRALAQSRPAGAVAAVSPRAPAPGPTAPRAPAAPLAAAPAPRPAAPPPPPKPAAPPPRQSTIAREPVAAEVEEQEAEAELSKWQFAVIAKTGAFKLSTTSQTLAALPWTYDKSSKPVAGLEAEFRHVDGFAVGAEVFYYKNDLTSPGTTLQAEQTVISGMLNGKYYFGGTEGWFHPFLGAGVGLAGAKFAGNLQGGSSGPSFQGMLGVDLRFSSVGLYLEYKYLNTTTSDSANHKVKADGSGFLAGVSVAF